MQQGYILSETDFSLFTQKPASLSFCFQNTMNLPPDKVKILSQYDNEKKWDLICDQVGRLSGFSLCFPPTLPVLPRVTSRKNKPINGTFYGRWTVKANQCIPTLCEYQT